MKMGKMLVCNCFVKNILIARWDASEKMDGMSPEKGLIFMMEESIQPAWILCRYASKVLVYGSYGYSGNLIVEHILSHAKVFGSALQLVLSGRNQKLLTAQIDRLEQGFGLRLQSRPTA
jgi:hypothetical protein